LKTSLCESSALLCNLDALLERLETSLGDFAKTLRRFAAALYGFARTLGQSSASLCKVGETLGQSSASLGQSAKALCKVPASLCDLETSLRQFAERLFMLPASLCEFAKTLFTRAPALCPSDARKSPFAGIVRRMPVGQHALSDVLPHPPTQSCANYKRLIPRIPRNHPFG
jgi:hypothetical protein